MLRPVLIALGLLLSACALGQRHGVPNTMLAGNGAAFGDLQALAARLADADVLLLGEVHDNAQGHATRTRLLREIDRLAPRPTVLAMEHFDMREQAALDRARAQAPDDVRAWIDVSSANRWPWELIQPTLELARDSNWAVKAVNLSRAQLRAAETAESDRLPLLPPAALAALSEIIRKAHCGMLNSTQAESLAGLQRRRDGAMAAALISAAQAGARVILLAGNGHVRKDFGVPRYLPATLQTRVVSVGFVEKAEAVESAGLYDYTVVISSQPRKDPCESLRMPKRGG